MAAMVKKRRWCGSFKASWVDSLQREVEDVEALLVVVSDCREMDQSAGAMARLSRRFYVAVCFVERKQRMKKREGEMGRRRKGGGRGGVRVWH
jgi:hypothetical protein